MTRVYNKNVLCYQDNTYYLDLYSYNLGYLRGDLRVCVNFPITVRNMALSNRENIDTLLNICFVTLFTSLWSLFIFSYFTRFRTLVHISLYFKNVNTRTLLVFGFYLNWNYFFPLHIQFFFACLFIFVVFAFQERSNENVISIWISFKLIKAINNYTYYTQYLIKRVCFRYARSLSRTIEIMIGRYFFYRLHGLPPYIVLYGLL